MSIIEDFISQYNREYDYYQKLAQIISSKIEDQLFKRGIKAIVTFRAKKPDRLSDKLSKRNDEKQYKTVDDVYKDIVDLAGVRVALYFPSDRDILEEIVSELFRVEKIKKFPDEHHQPVYKKRFSGYWATHYRVRLKEDALIMRYSETLVEIQVASVLMHAWSEVEHDLVYKPFSGELSDGELAILDEINGLVLSGEIALERLQVAMAERTRSKREINDKFELVNFLMANLDKKSHDTVKLGNTFLLNSFLKSNKTINTNFLTKLIHNINTDLNESVTDQLLNMLFGETLNKYSSEVTKEYFKRLHISDRKASIFEQFVKYWVVLEKATRELVGPDKKGKKYIIPDFEVLKLNGILDDEESREIIELRRLRNYLLHGINSPKDDELRSNLAKLKSITSKVVHSISDEKIRIELQNEINRLN